MKLLIDFLPIVIFFIVYKFAPECIDSISPLLNAEQLQQLTDMPAIILATAVLIPATMLQILYTKISTGKVETMHLVTLALVVIMGGATVISQDKTFIQWKPTVVNWLFAAAFLGSRFFGEKTILQRMMGQNLSLPAPAWQKLNYAWVAFFTFSGIANLYVAYNFSEDIWVNFKLFGLLGLTFAFIVAQSFYLYRFMNPEGEEK
ncbi:septation protein A [Oleispira antarctica]|uniref:Inner membrane-spanning protein YciB n=1 Tax=Oleispira antarctica TaxID=188908 RepID=A0A1Y5HRZ4_OLEAN|nr:septation protein A [Oleispira antarctica]